MSGDVRVRLYPTLLEIALAAEPETVISELTKTLVALTKADAGYVALRTEGRQREYAYGAGGEILRARISDLAPIAHVQGDVVIANTANHVAIVGISRSKQSGLIAVQRATALGAFTDAERQLLNRIAADLALAAEQVTAPPSTLGDQIQTLEMRRIRESLARHRGNVSAVARELRVARTRIYRVIRRGKLRGL